MRGIHHHTAAPGRYWRINLAYAGNAYVTGVRGHGAGDQPRVCGEYGLSGRHGLHKRGSTPRVRGVHLPTSKLTIQIPVPGTTLIIH